MGHIFSSSLQFVLMDRFFHRTATLMDVSALMSANLRQCKTSLPWHSVEWQFKCASLFDILFARFQIPNAGRSTCSLKFSKISAPVSPSRTDHLRSCRIIGPNSVQKHGEPPQYKHKIHSGSSLFDPSLSFGPCYSVSSHVSVWSTTKPVSSF